MDYSIGLTQPSNDISYTIKEAMRYGGMPDSQLLNKFEETDLGDEELKYNNYMREQIMAFNKSAEPTLESDLPRTSYAPKGIINLWYSGNRSGEEPAMPEIFTELTDKEPRRTATDPDYRQIADQWQGRMRFKYFYPDADNSITQGNWDARQRSYAGKAIQELMRARMQIFSTSYDGRREGLRRTYDNKSTIDKVSAEDSYGDAVKSDGLNPQRATTILSNRNLQRTKLYQQFTTDHEFAVSRYGEGRRGNYLASNEVIRKIRSDNRYNDQDMNQTRKALGILMTKSINQSKNVSKDGQNIEYTDAILTQGRKSTKPYRDLSYLIREISQDQIQNRAYNYRTRKMPGLPNWRSHLPTDTEEDAEKPHVNTELMYKALKPSADVQKIKSQILRDQDQADSDANNKTGKSNNQRRENKLPNTEISVDGVSYKTHIYKSKNASPRNNARTTTETQHDVMKSDESQIRKTSGKNYETATTKNTIDDSNFSDNTYMDRHAAPLGDKMAIRRKIDRDNLDTSINT